MSDKTPTDDELRKLQGKADLGPMKRLGEISPEILALLCQIEENIIRREEREGPHTHACSDCRDTGFTLRTDDKGQLWSTPCRMCLIPTTSGMTASEIRAVPWEIDGDDRVRLRYHRAAEPTLWIYPKGRMISYPPHKELPEIDPSLYAEVYEQARRAKRIGVKELSR